MTDACARVHQDLISSGAVDPAAIAASRQAANALALLSSVESAINCSSISLRHRQPSPACMAALAGAASSGRTRDQHIALSMNWSGQLPNVYHHIWDMLYSLWHTVVRPRTSGPGRQEGERTYLYLPAGSHICRRGADALVEFDLFASCFSSLHVERVPWVPFCLRGCCWSGGYPPSPVAKQLVLMTNFASFLCERSSRIA